MKVTINRPKCLRSGQCTYLHPKLFKEGEDGFPIILLDEIPADLEQEAEDAADVCPSGAIDTED
jgi:ferredoxin